jgi:hypothetical protein
VGELNEQNFEEYFIESIENNLSSAELANLDEFVSKNPHLQKTLNTYKMTVIQPDQSVVFDKKEMLKKTVVVPLYSTPMRRMIMVSISVAAIMAVILISGIIIRSFTKVDKCGVNILSMVKCGHVERNTNKVIAQNPGNKTYKVTYKVSNQTPSENKSYAAINSSARAIPLETLKIKKSYCVDPKLNNELAASVNLVKRSEYTDLMDECELILNRRNNEKSSHQEEGLADYVVTGIKSGARNATKNKDDIKDNKHLGFWDVAGFGLYAYNKITDNNLLLDKKTNASGRLMSFNIEDDKDSNEKK